MLFTIWDSYSLHVVCNELSRLGRVFSFILFVLIGIASRSNIPLHCAMNMKLNNIFLEWWVRNCLY